MIDNSEFVATLQKLVSERATRVCPDSNCTYIKAAIIEAMVPHIGPLTQALEDKTREYALSDEMPIETFVTNITYEVMVAMGNFAGTSVQTTLSMCNACNQASAIEKGDRH